MDRVTFLQSIRTENQSIIIRYFDQFMGIYGLIPDSDFTIKVRTPENLTQGIVLDFTFKSPLRLDEIRNHLEEGGTTITMYQHTYLVQMFASSPNGFSLLVGL